MRISKAHFIALAMTFLSAVSEAGFGQTSTDDKQAWVSIGQIRSSGNFASCQRYDLSKLTSTLLNDQLKASGRFRIFENEQVAELRFGGEITSCSVSTSQILFVSSATVKFAVNITAVDIVTSEKIISETVEGETSLSGVSFIGTFLTDADFKKALEDVLKARIPRLIASKDLAPYITHAQGERAVPRQSNTVSSPPSPNPQSLNPNPPTVSTVSVTTANVAVAAMLEALKGVDFNTFNNSLSDNLLSLSNLRNLAQFATPENKEVSSKIFYAIQSSQAYGDAYTVFDLLIVIPSKSGAPISKNLKVGVINTGGQFAQLFPSRANQGLKVIFLSKDNPYRVGLAAQLPIFNTSSDAVEQLFKDYLAALGIQI